MASAEDVGAKRQMFYEIECVIDDCDADVEYKPLSDSDEFDEEEEPREEDIDSSEEWEPLMQSKLKKNASPSSSSSLPRRRGRPRKNVSNPPLPAPVKQILPKIAPAPPGVKRRRGRPPKDTSKIKLLPKPTLYPMIVPKPPVFATLIPNTSAQNLKLGPNSTSTITLGPNFSPLTLSSPTSSVNLNPNSAPILIPNSTSAFNLSPNSATSASNSQSLATLFCTTTTSTKILVDGDSRGSKAEEQTSVNATEEESPAPKDENPEFSESPNAKRQRLSLAFLPLASAQQISGSLNHISQPVSDHAPASESSPELSFQPSPTTMDDQLTSIFGSDPKPEADSDLDGDTDGISDSEKEDELWEDDFDSGEDWNLLREVQII
ncbi:uncharacterized protein LOC130247934 [Danio aesculapii]|uniref:uncharacterized protein LOC130247934 n=1 Tax=Danio aesculapii TaxID=1142201 RepID=UPI0024BF962D|nr:uncharacterized protein LOC130247934 [Danio aesculapii]